MYSAIRPRYAAIAASDRCPGMAFGVLVVMLACAYLMPAKAAPSILQRGYDSNVSGANLNETALNAGNVTANTFGLLFKLPVDDAIFAQPLYVPNVAIPNMGSHNVVYVATMSDSTSGLVALACAWGRFERSTSSATPPSEYRAIHL